ncbi:MAG: hypothetical protein HY343_10380, partial [Lentisphaerae bacterium]|nr:hypothetical protein [Lentisphaerota bacterium]
KPVLSAASANQAWCRVTLYSPSVLLLGGVFRMWFIGNASRSRATDHELGYAESVDGLHWIPHAGNPIATPRDIPWGKNWQTPCVRYDAAAHRFRMWFVSTTACRFTETADSQPYCLDLTQALGYAESEDGLAWHVHPEPLYPSGRGPSVLPLETGGLVMWMNSRPDDRHPWDDVYKNIYRFTSPDGLHWTRDESPSVRPSGSLATCVYPCVVAATDGLAMLHGAHVPDKRFEIFGATSRDGRDWTCRHDVPVLPATRRPDSFDGRYTSTPCIVRDGRRLLFFYSARPPQNTYVDGEGHERQDRCGVYNSIGVAIRTLSQDPDLTDTATGSL